MLALPLEKALLLPYRSRGINKAKRKVHAGRTYDPPHPTQNASQEDEVCSPDTITMNLKVYLANPQISAEALERRLKDSMNGDVLRRITDQANKNNKKRDSNNALVQVPSLESFKQKLELAWQAPPGGVGGLDDVKKFKKLGICTFNYPANPNLFVDLEKKPIPGTGNERSFFRFKENKTAWSRLDRPLREEIETFVKNYFASFEHNNGREIVGVSNLIISPVNRGDNKLVIQKLHLDHMYGYGHEVVVAIDFSGKPLLSRYFTASHRIPGFHSGFNSRLNRGQGDLGSHDEPGVACNTTRVADMLIHAINTGVDINYVQAPSNGMVFDAGGLHSGNAVLSDGPRVFWTFRTASFHNKLTDDIRKTGDQDLANVDLWFPQVQREWLTLGKLP